VRNKLEKLWQSFEGFADYAFNRAHSFSYGYLAYQTAYLKAHFPTHFWAAVLSNELNNTAKVVKYINEARTQSIEILPPDVNESLDNFTPSGNTIRFGLAAIKGIGQSAVSCIVEARDSGGRFKSLYDFTERVDSRAVNRRVVEGLIKSGALDSMGYRRAQLFAVIDSAIEGGQREQRSRAAGQGGLFGAMGLDVPIVEPRLPDMPEWSHLELLKGEKETLGFYISGHPLLKHEQALRDFTTTDVDRLSNHSHGSQVILGGIVMECNVKTTKKGDRFVLFFIEDQFGSVKVVAWPDVFSKCNGTISNDAAVLVRGRLEIDDGGAMTIIAEEVQSLENLRERLARTLVLHLPARAITPENMESLYKLLDSNRGECGIVFEIELEDKRVARIQPNQFVKVKASPELTAAISRLVPGCSVELHGQRANGAGSGR
jgi:DNA polymerase III subunit alpha